MRRSSSSHQASLLVPRIPLKLSTRAGRQYSTIPDMDGVPIAFWTHLCDMSLSCDVTEAKELSGTFEELVEIAIFLISLDKLDFCYLE
uniref:Uncharacterized protein n=1 Tax=Steinernema glaseri TaxID=37863 RepID=A0A1I7ZTU6_9BILA